MADAQKNLSIKITTTADTSGFQKTGAAIDDLGAKTKESGKASEAAAEGGKKLELSHREILELTRKLAPGMEGLGHVLTNLTNPLALAAFGFVLCQRALEDYNKTLDEAASKNAEADFAKAIDATRAAMEKGATAAADYADKMAHLIDPEDQFARATQNAIAAIHEQAAAQNEMGEAAHGLDVDKLKLQLEQGLISQEQYFIKLGELEKRHEVEKLAIQREAEKAELDIQQKSVAALNDKQPDLEQAAKTARVAATSAAAKAETDAASLEILKGKLPDAQKKANEAEEKINRLGGVGAVTERANYKGWDPFANQEAPKAAEQLREYQAAVKASNDLQTHIQELSGRLGGEKAGASAADRDAARAEGRSEKNAGRIEEGIDKYYETERRFTAADAAGAARAGLRIRDQDVRTATDLTHMGLDPGAAQRAGAGGQVVSDMSPRGPDMGPLNDAHSRVATQASETVRQTTAIAASLSNLAGAVLGHGRNIQSQIDDIVRQLNRLTSRSNSGISGNTQSN